MQVLDWKLVQAWALAKQQQQLPECLWKLLRLSRPALPCIGRGVPTAAVEPEGQVAEGRTAVRQLELRLWHQQLEELVGSQRAAAHGMLYFVITQVSVYWI